jgi:hypothetical protein
LRIYSQKNSLKKKHLFSPLNKSPEKEKADFLEKKFSLRRLNWADSLVGCAWEKPAHGPHYRLQQGGALLAVGCDPTDQRASRQNKTERDCGRSNPSAFLPSSPSSTDASGDGGTKEDDGGRRSGPSSRG